MNEIQKLKEKRATILAAVKEIMARAKGRPEAEQDLTAEEQGQVDGLYAEFDKAGARVETLERQTKLERAEAQLAEVTRRTTGPIVRDDSPRVNMGEAVRAWMLRASGNISAEAQLNAQRAGIDLNSSVLTVRFNPENGEVYAYNGDGQYGDNHIRRDMLTTAGSSALTTWKEFTDRYDRAEKFYGNAQAMVSTIQTDTGVALPIPTFDDTSNAGRWLGEGVTATNTDTTPGSVTLNAYMASSDQIPISLQLLQDGQVSMNMILPSLLGERIGRLVNRGIVVGAGTTEPTGIMTSASASGVVIAGTNAAPTYSWDNMLDLKGSVDPAYWQAPPDKRGFLMSSTLLMKYRKLKDANSRYFADPFTPGPGTIDGDPIKLNNEVLSTGINAKIAAYGDYSRYLFRSVMEVTFYRLDQIKLLDGKVVFMALRRCDGKLLNTSAVKTLANPAT